MTNRFISAWCYEHDFTDKLGAVIALEGLEEKDLKEENFSEDGCEITVLDKNYTVYNLSDVDDMISDKQIFDKDDIILQLDSNPAFVIIEDYINWEKYFDDRDYDESDVLSPDFVERDFNGNTFFICED
jgi:hypothetical protein